MSDAGGVAGPVGTTPGTPTGAFWCYTVTPGAGAAGSRTYGPCRPRPTTLYRLTPMTLMPVTGALRMVRVCVTPVTQRRHGRTVRMATDHVPELIPGVPWVCMYCDLVRADGETVCPSRSDGIHMLSLLPPGTRPAQTRQTEYPSFCPECGFGVPLDDEDCCVSCGAVANGTAVRTLYDRGIHK